MGYFSKLVYSDYFVIQDSTLFSKMKYIDRTRIINTSGDIQWIGFPIGQNYKVMINQIEVGSRKNLNSIIKNIEYSYSKARYYKELWPKLKKIIIDCISSSEKLLDINVKLIINLMNFLMIPVPKIIYLSSFELDNTLDDTDKLIQICKKLMCNKIILGSGGSMENHDLCKVSKNNISIYYQDYYGLHPVYYQTRRTRLGFEKGLSIIDCILNEGIKKTRSLLFDQRCIPQRIEIREKEGVK